MSILSASSAAAAPNPAISLAINKLPGTFTAGGKPGVFDATVDGPGDAPGGSPVVRQYVIRLDGLVGANVTAERQGDRGEWVTLPIAATSGVVTVRDEDARQRTSKIRLAFAAKAPAGRVTLTVEGYDPRDNRLLGRSATYQTTVKQAGPGSSASAGSSALPVVTVPPAQSPSAASTAPAAPAPPAAAPPRPELPVAGTSGLLIGLGALMVLGGLGAVIILALVSGRTPQEAAAKEESAG